MTIIKSGLAIFKENDASAIEGIDVTSTKPTANQVLKYNATTNKWEPATDAAGTGDVVGPSSAVANNVALFNGVTGKLIKDAGVSISGSNTGDETQATIKTKLGASSSSADGYLTHADWERFNNKISNSSIAAQGDVLYFDGSNWVVLHAGTNGQFLKTQGSSANPIWASAAGGGDVLGPATNTDNYVPIWNGNNSKTLSDGLEVETEIDANSSDASIATSLAIKNYITSAISGKQDTITGAGTTIVSSDLTASRAIQSSSTGKVEVSSVTSTELGYLSGVTGAIQTQLGNKQATITGAATTVTSSDLTASKALASDASGKIVASSVSDTELGYLSGVTGAIQTQLNAKSTKLTTNTTVNITSDMTAAQIQALINAQPKNLGGHTLTFQFGDGTYNTSMTSALTFQYFYNGNLNIYGNTGEADASALHTSQSVYLDFSAGTSNGIIIDKCFGYVYLRNLKIKISDTASVKCIDVVSTPIITIRYNYLLGAAKTNINNGMRCNYGFSYVGWNYVSNLYYGITSQCGSLFSVNNDDTGTAPNYGLQAYQVGTIGKSGTQPAGSTSNELISEGGEIR